MTSCGKFASTQHGWTHDPTLFSQTNTMKNHLNRRHFIGTVSLGGPAALATATATAADSPTQLRILCYNIHYGQGMDGNYDIPRIAEVIKAVKPDIVALQEIDVHVERSGRIHELRMLADETGMAGRYGPTQHYQGGLYGNGILSNLPYRDNHIQPLPYTEATPELVTYPRNAFAVVVEAPNGKLVRVISTHFQHASFEEDRIAEAKAINEHFASDNPADDVMGAEAAALPTILAGDLNAVPGSLPIDEIGKKWTLVMEDDPVPTVPVANPKSRIDFIGYRKTDSVRVVEQRVIDEKMASDHLPVFAVLEIPG
jgi:endonuclease/exonuclease/phosphatase family metal-dependent hydrolase